MRWVARGVIFWWAAWVATGRTATAVRPVGSSASRAAALRIVYNAKPATKWQSASAATAPNAPAVVQVARPHSAPHASITTISPTAHA